MPPPLPVTSSSRVSAEPPQLGLNLLPSGTGERSTKALRLVGLDPTLAVADDNSLATPRPAGSRRTDWASAAAGRRPSAGALADALLDWSPDSSTPGSSTGDLLLQRPLRSSSSPAAEQLKADSGGGNREGKLMALLGLPTSPSASPDPSPMSSRKSSTTVLSPASLAGFADYRIPAADPLDSPLPPPTLPQQPSASSSAGGSLAQRKHHNRRTSLSIGGINLGFGSLGSGGSGAGKAGDGERSPGASPTTATTASSSWSKRSFSSGRNRGASSQPPGMPSSSLSESGYIAPVDSPSSARGSGPLSTPQSTPSAASTAPTPVISSPLLSPAYTFQSNSSGRPALTSSYSTGSVSTTSGSTGWQKSHAPVSAAAAPLAGAGRSGRSGRFGVGASSSGPSPLAAAGLDNAERRRSSGLGKGLPTRRGSASDQPDVVPPATSSLRPPTTGSGSSKSKSVQSDVKPSGGSMRDLVGFLRWGSGGGKEKDRAALEEAEVERLAEKEEDVGRLPGFSNGPLPRLQSRLAIAGARSSKPSTGLARSRSTSAAGPSTSRAPRPLPLSVAEPALEVAPTPPPSAARRFLNLGRSAAPTQTTPPQAAPAASLPLRTSPMPTYIYVDEGFDDVPSVLYPRPPGGLSQAELSLAHALWVNRTLSPHPSAEAIAAGHPDHRLFYLPPGGKEGTVREARDRLEAERRGAGWSAERKAAWWFETGERLAGWDFDAVLRERAQAVAASSVQSGRRHRTRTARQGDVPRSKASKLQPHPGEAALTAKSSTASFAPSLAATTTASFTTSLLTTPTGQTLALDESSGAPDTCLEHDADAATPTEEGSSAAFLRDAFASSKTPSLAPFDRSLGRKRELVADEARFGTSA